jgi:predicted ATPase with chaperone activity
MRVAEVRQFCKLDEMGESLVRAAMSQLQLSAGGITVCSSLHAPYENRVGQAIADLAGSDDI